MLLDLNIGYPFEAQDSPSLKVPTVVSIQLNLFTSTLPILTDTRTASNTECQRSSRKGERDSYFAARGPRFNMFMVLFNVLLRESF